MPEQPDITVTLTLPAWEADRLSALIDPDQGLPDLEAVIGTLLDHVQQGVCRRGAWERSWLCSAFGEDWLERLEPDPGSPHHDRVRRPEPEGGDDA
jgi:hypothetical protein